jgi:hypothetical protein
VFSSDIFLEGEEPRERKGSAFKFSTPDELLNSPTEFNEGINLGSSLGRELNSGNSILESSGRSKFTCSD